MEEIKQDNSKNFAALLEEDLATRSFKEGQLVTGVVEEITSKFVYIDLKMKSSAAIPLDEFKMTQALDKISVGSSVELLLEKLENRDGEVVVSYEKAKRAKSWSRMERSFEKGETVKGSIISKCRGGMVVDSDSCLMFLPGSQISLRPVKDLSSLMKVPLEFAIVKMDRKRGNIVCSRRAVLESIRDKDREKSMKDIKVGQVLKDCVCKSIQSWGIFFSYDNLDLLVHINELSWQRVTDPNDLLKVGQTCNVLLHKIENGRLSGSLKRLKPDPFIEAAKKYKVGDIVENCEVQSLKQYGAFVNIEPNLCGLIHSSNLDHLNSNVNPSQVLSVSQRISVKILSLDEKERKLSLSYKDCFESPLITFKEKYKKDSIVNCKVKNKNEYAAYLFIEDTPIVGFLHVSNFAYENSKAEELLSKIKKNDNLRCKIYDIDETTLKVQLTHKHLQSNPYDYFLDKVGSIITVSCGSLTSAGLSVYAGPKKNIKILIKRNQLADKSLQASRFTPGSKIDVMIKKESKPEKSKVILSVKDAEAAETAAQIKKYGSKVGTGAVLGDILGKALKTVKKKK